MPTYSFSLNRDQVIQEALELTGVIAEGETPNANQITSASTTLNLILKSWATDGLHLWKIRKYIIPLVAGQGVYNTTTLAMPKPLKLIEAYLQDIATSTTSPLTIISREEYNLLNNPAQTASPTQIYNNVNRADCDFYVYPPPDTTTAISKQIIVWVQIPMEDVTLSTDIVDIPSEWCRACTYGLALDLADKYGLPERKLDRLEKKAERLRAEAASFDVENSSVYFGVDPQSRYEDG